MSRKNKVFGLLMLSLLVLGILVFKTDSQSSVNAASTDAVATEMVLPKVSSAPILPAIPNFFAATVSDPAAGPGSGTLQPAAIAPDLPTNVVPSLPSLVSGETVCPFEDTPTLKSGASGAEVEELQQELKVFNPKLKISGKFDSATQGTLRTLEKKLGVPAKSGIDETVKAGLCRVFYQCGRPVKVTVTDPDGTTFYKGKYYPAAIAWKVELKELPILGQDNTQTPALSKIRYCPLQHDLYLMNGSETIGEIPFDNSINANQQGYRISFPIISLTAPWRVPELMNQQADVPDGSNYTVKVVTTGILGGKASGESKLFTIASLADAPKPPSCRDCDSLRKQLLGLLQQLAGLMEQMEKLLQK